MGVAEEVDGRVVAGAVVEVDGGTDVVVVVVVVCVDEVVGAGEEDAGDQHSPQAGWHPVEQWAEELPHHPYCEQQ